MGAKKIRGSRKSLEPAEVILTWSERLQERFEAHANVVYGAVAAVLVIAAVVWGVRVYGNAQEHKAQVAYATLSESWPNAEAGKAPDYTKIIPQLEKFVADYHGTDASVNADLDLARAYYAVQRYADAAKVASQALHAGSSDPALKPLIRYQLAMTYEALADSDQAIQQWSALQSEGAGGLNREVNWHLARLYMAKNDPTKAIAAYEQALKAEGAYPNTTMIEEELASARTKSGIPAPAKEAKS